MNELSHWLILPVLAIIIYIGCHIFSIKNPDRTPISIGDSFMGAIFFMLFIAMYGFPPLFFAMLFLPQEFTLPFFLFGCGVGVWSIRRSTIRERQMYARPSAPSRTNQQTNNADTPSAPPNQSKHR